MACNFNQYALSDSRLQIWDSEKPECDVDLILKDLTFDHLQNGVVVLSDGRLNIGLTADQLTAMSLTIDDIKTAVGIAAVGEELAPLTVSISAKTDSGEIAAGAFYIHITPTGLLGPVIDSVTMPTGQPIIFPAIPSGQKYGAIPYTASGGKSFTVIEIR